MATRVIKGTLDSFSVDSGSDVTYQGPGTGLDRSENVRCFQVNPGTTGDITVTLNQAVGVVSMEIFQEDNYSGSSAASGYKLVSFVERDGKGKGAVGVTVTDATKNYVCMLTLDGYSEVAYSGTVETP